MTTKLSPGELAAAQERHGSDLRKVNERLRDLVQSLKSENERLAEVRAAGSDAAGAPAPAPDLEKRRLAAELSLAREAVEHAQAERERLRTRLDDIERENRRVCDEFVALEGRASELAQLYVALERLHGGLTRADALVGLQEIVINLVGSEEFALFEVQGGRGVLVHHFGIDPTPYRDVALGRGPIGRVLAGGPAFVAGRDGAVHPADDDLSACVPLRVGERVIGALAVFRLLSHKPALEPNDLAVLDLLTAHAGLALRLRAGAALAGA